MYLKRHRGCPDAAEDKLMNKLGFWLASQRRFVNFAGLQRL
jgi:hypothetical protein